MVRLSKYEFYNKLLGGVTLLKVTWNQWRIKNQKQCLYISILYILVEVLK